MNSLRVVYHLTRADFLERTRSYSFLVVLGLVVFLGYQVTIGDLGFQLGQYRGEFNSAWVGAMMSIIATFFLSWFGFYVVKGSIARDRKTNVGQIIATTPITRSLYMLGKQLSNLAVLMAIAAILALAGVIFQVWIDGTTHLDLPVFFAPFLFIVFPLISLVAAISVVFDAVPFLQGGFGNIVYFVAFIIGNMGRERSVYGPTGIGLLENSMGKTALAVYPNYDGYFSLGTTEQVFTFTWTGVHWTLDLILARFAFIALAVVLALTSALFFDRFDSKRQKTKKTKTNALHIDVQSAALSPIFPAVRLAPLAISAYGFRFPSVLLAELRLLLKGPRWWWYLAALGFIVIGFEQDAQTTREAILPFIWIWPVLIWSTLGNRETFNNTHQMIFSSAFPLRRQLPAQWLAGFIFTSITGSGAALRFMISSDIAAMHAWLAGALFIPSLALALGVWSGTRKTFEIVYLSIWLMGPITQNIIAFDFTNSSGVANPTAFMLASLVLVAFAAFGRAGQLQK